MAMAAADPRRLYRDIVDVEKQLRELLRSNPLNAQDANALRRRLVDDARQLALAAPTFAAQRELEQVLWKPCFYKRIEDFRRRIRKYASAPAADRSVREHFAKVSHEFQEFLTDASAFYDHLRDAYTTWLLQHRVTRIASSLSSSSASINTGINTGMTPLVSEAAENVDKCRTSLHRCLVFLGDLARYRELHSQKAKKNFVAAENFYYKALAVIPENGNPHNQLAVLATYVEAETVAVYRYCRSLLIAQPFVTAEENLALLFERSRQRPLAPPTAATTSITATSSAKDKAAALKSFLHRLTRMHGILFSIATRPSASNAASSSSSSIASPPAVYSKDMESLLMKDLLMLLPSGVVGDALLIKLVVTNIFCIEKATRTTAAEDAVRLALRMVRVVLQFVLAELAKAQQSQSDTGNDATPPNALRVLGAVSTFCDYLRCNGRVIRQVDEQLSREEELEVGKRFVKDLLEKLVKLLNHSKTKSSIQSIAGVGSVKELQLQLKENVELRGFKPLSTLIDAGSANRWRDDLASGAAQAKTDISDAEALKIRVWNIHEFGKFLCEEYSGSPLLYYYKGEFSTSPSVVTGVLNGLSSTPSSNAFASPLGLFSGLSTSSTSTTNGLALHPTTGADDFDDEIIVYQPSPALTPSQPRGEGSSALGGSANSFLGPDPFSLGSSAVFSSTLKPASAPASGQLSLSSPGDSVFGSLGSGSRSSSLDSDAAISSSLGYPGFSSFGDLGAFSGQGFLGSPWQSTTTQQQARSPVTSLSRSFVGSTNSPSETKPGNTSLFAAMDDLAAIERESSMYQQKESSLSAFLNPSRLTMAPAAPAWGGATPLGVRSASVGASRPPTGSAPPGFGPSPAIGDAPRARSPPQQQQFFTRNPFANP